jgi:hypothetical protein
LKVTQSDGTALPDGAAIIPSNYFFYTLYKNATLLFNNVKIEGGDDTYSSKAILESILNYNTDTRNTNLMSIGFSNDENVRKEWISKSKEFSMTGPLRLNLFNQPKYLLPGVNVTIKLRRNINGISLKTTDAALKLVIKIIEAKLLVRRVKVEPSVLIGHQLSLAYFYI